MKNKIDKETLLFKIDQQIKIYQGEIEKLRSKSYYSGGGFLKHTRAIWIHWKKGKSEVEIKQLKIRALKELSQFLNNEDCSLENFQKQFEKYYLEKFDSAHSEDKAPINTDNRYVLQGKQTYHLFQLAKSYLKSLKSIDKPRTTYHKITYYQ